MAAPIQRHGCLHTLSLDYHNSVRFVLNAFRRHWYLDVTYAPNPRRSRFTVLNAFRRY